MLHLGFQVFNHDILSVGLCLCGHPPAVSVCVRVRVCLPGAHECVRA